MSTGLLRLHEPAVLLIALRDPRQCYVYRKPLPVDLGAPIREVSCPDDLGSMSYPHDVLRIRTSSLIICPGEGLCLLSFGLFCPRGSSSTGFYPFATLTSVLHLKDSRQSNYQTNSNAILMNLNIPGGDQYTQNHP